MVSYIREDFDRSPIPKDFDLEVAKGKVPGHTRVLKFGTASVGTTLQPITIGGFYRTPTTATALEFVSSSSGDTSDAAGAREITIEGLGADWLPVTQTLATNGTTAVALDTNLTRLYRWYVSASGTYATQSAGSHTGTLTIRESGGGDVWSQIDLIGTMGKGQSQIGAYTVPADKTAFVRTKFIFVDSTKQANVYFFQRPNADDVTAPFSGTMRLVQQEIGLTDNTMVKPYSPLGPFPGPCDIGFLGKVAQNTGDVSVDFEIMLIDNARVNV